MGYSLGISEKPHWMNGPILSLSIPGSKPTPPAMLPRSSAKPQRWSGGTKPEYPMGLGPCLSHGVWKVEVQVQL